MTTTNTAPAKLTIGTRMYYTGDVCNDSGFGTITDVTDDPRHGIYYTISLEDGRVFRLLPHVSCVFSGPGRRFWLSSEWEAKQTAAIEQCRRAAEDWRRRRAG